MDPDIGLVRGVYAFNFSDTRRENDRFDDCNDVLSQVQDILYGLYGEGNATGSGCDDGYYESWDWGNVTVEILTSYTTRAAALGVMYRNHDLETKMGDADRKRRF